MTSTLCNSLKKTFPESQVDYLVHEINAQLYVDHPYIDSVIPISAKERKNPLLYFKKLLLVRSRQYDIIIDSTSTAKSELFSLFSQSTKIRIGRKKKKRGSSYTHTVDEKSVPGDKIKQRLQLLKPLEDDGVPVIFDSKMELRVSEQERKSMQAVMIGQGLNLQRPIFIFSVTAKLKEKQWSTEYLAQVAMHCIEQYNAQIVLFCGSDQEAKDIKAFEELLLWNVNVFAGVPAKSLRNLASLISNADMFIGNEGGPRHISQALDIPSVAIYSPTYDRREWHPGASDRFRSIGWKDMSKLSDTSVVAFKTGDSTYMKLYQSIDPLAVIALVDDVVSKHISVVK